MVDFLVIGPYSTIAYNNVFPLIREDIIRIGYNKVFKFSDGRRSSGSIWFSSFDVQDRPPLHLKEYREGDYYEYDHFSAINVDNIKDIPDFPGVIGVPITFVEKWCKRQFDILDARDYRKDDRFRDMEVQTLSSSGGEAPAVNGERRFARILIRKK